MYDLDHILSFLKIGDSDLIRLYIDNNEIIQYPVCMPRIARVVVKALPYHATQRGNYRQSVFRDGSVPFGDD
jgi:hypothetical protein